MANPYRDKPDHQFWRRAVSGRAAIAVDPVIDPGWRIGRGEKIATAGSCFAQHIARTLASEGFGYLVTEAAPAHAFSGTEQYGLFSARYGNVYTVRQLRQLFDRAYGMFVPRDSAWCRADGRFVDPFRPNIHPEGFANEEQVVADRASHLAAVRTMFETCDVFIFTLGLTEAWIATTDGAVFPLAPGVVSAGVRDGDYAFANFGVAEMGADLARLLADVRGVNPGVRIILTVSPVPLAATYEPQHVLTATTYSKAALRVLAEDATRDHPDVTYFPSFEMITGPHARGMFWAEDLREVEPRGVAYVMQAFATHFLEVGVGEQRAPPPLAAAPPPSVEAVAAQAREIAQVGLVICDEELIERET